VDDRRFGVLFPAERDFFYCCVKTGSGSHRLPMGTRGTLSAGSKRSGREAVTITPFPYVIPSVVGLQLTFKA
jgi:hypothetical protein